MSSSVRSHSLRWFVLLAAAGSAVLIGAAAPRAPVVIVLDAGVRDSMNAIWSRSNQHWNEVADQNTLTQMIGSGKPTQREYMGCLRGRRYGGTIRVFATEPAHDMKQLQFAVTGNCDGVQDLVGTWHTHPFRADSAGHALKEPGLSKQDLTTFSRDFDDAVVAVWDVDSMDAAARDVDGTLLHPVDLRVVIP